MPTLTDRNSKLVQYLNEAYGKEKELEAALEAHIGMTTRAAYKKQRRNPGTTADLTVATLFAHRLMSILPPTLNSG